MIPLQYVNIEVLVWLFWFLEGSGLVTEYVSARASETLDQGELVAFLKSRFPETTRPVGRTIVEGTEGVEVRVFSDSPEFEEIRKFIDARRKQGLHGFSDFTTQ
jgi:hypothetical protein